MSQQSIDANSGFVDGRVKVDVKIIRAENLQVDGKPNAYVQVSLQSDESQKKKTAAIKNDPNPNWNETLSFLVQDIETETLLINECHP